MSSTLPNSLRIKDLQKTYFHTDISFHHRFYRFYYLKSSNQFYRAHYDIFPNRPFFHTDPFGIISMIGNGLNIKQKIKYKNLKNNE